LQHKYNKFIRLSSRLFFIPDSSDTDYIIDLNDNSFGYISWQITNSVMKVAIIPNSFQLIEVPVAVLGEASGMVYIEKNGKKSGLGRIIIKFYDEDWRLYNKLCPQ